MADYEVGYGKPPKHTRWVKGGPSPNPGGKTREHRLAEIRAAELAAKVQLDLVKALSNAMDESTGNEAKLAQIRADVLKLLKDSQDRGFGAPTQPTEISNPDGSLVPSTVRIVAVNPDDRCGDFNSGGRSPVPIETEAPAPNKK